MSIFTNPMFNVGATVMQPGMNPMVKLPGGSTTAMGLPSTGYGSAGAMQPLPANWGQQYGLTPQWGQINQPMANQFINPSPYINSLKTVQPPAINMNPTTPAWQQWGLQGGANTGKQMIFGAPQFIPAPTAQPVKPVAPTLAAKK